MHRWRCTICISCSRRFHRLCILYRISNLCIGHAPSLLDRTTRLQHSSCFCYKSRSVWDLGWVRYLAGRWVWAQVDGQLRCEGVAALAFGTPMSKTRVLMGWLELGPDVVVSSVEPQRRCVQSRFRAILWAICLELFFCCPRSVCRMFGFCCTILERSHFSGSNCQKFGQGRCCYWCGCRSILFISWSLLPLSRENYFSSELSK